MSGGAGGRLSRSLPTAMPLLVAGALNAMAGQALPMTPLSHTISALVPFTNSAFPYEGFDPETKMPFLDISQNGRRGHTSGRGGGIYWLDTTYSDNRALLALPEGFDLKRSAVLVVFFHGNNATLENDVIGRQQVVAQLAASGLNGVLVAPQMAVDALDSSAGGFWTRGTFARFLREAAAHLADFYKDAPAARALFDKLPVVIVAYSGGYDPAAFALAVGGAGNRVKGVVLLDAAFGQTDTFVDWVARNRQHAFFFSAYTESSAAGNAAIKAGLANEDVDYAEWLPRTLVPGSVSFLSVDGADHEDFVTLAWVNQPLAWLFARIPGFPRPARVDP